MRPLSDALLKGLGLEDDPPTVGAVCVYPTMVPAAVKALKGSGIPVAPRSPPGFPTGLTPLPQRLAEIKYAVGEGAGEIDIVINRALVFDQEWQALYDEVAAMREGLRRGASEGHPRHRRSGRRCATSSKASMVSMQAGADFIKTSTGKEDVNATLPVSLVMIRALRDYGEQTGYRVGFKPAGGTEDRQGRHELADPDEGGARPAVAGARAFPHRREFACSPTSSASSSISSPAAIRPPTVTRWPEGRTMVHRQGRS